VNKEIYLKLNLYTVDIKYIRDLHRVDDRVYSVSPQICKDKRVFVGVIVICNTKKYIIPLSSVKIKHYKMKPCADFDKIYDKKGNLIAVLNFNLMIPVTDKQIQEVDLMIRHYDSPEEKAFKALCINEIEYCRKPHMSKIISDKAKNLYDLCTKDINYKGKIRCLDFEKLEMVCEKYNKRIQYKS